MIYSFSYGNIPFSIALFSRAAGFVLLLYPSKTGNCPGAEVDCFPLLRCASRCRNASGRAGHITHHIASDRFSPRKHKNPAARQMHTAGTLYLLFWLFCAITRSISCWVCMTSSWKLLAETRTAPWPRMMSCSRLSLVATRTLRRPRSS